MDILSYDDGEGTNYVSTYNVLEGSLNVNASGYYTFFVKGQNMGSIDMTLDDGINKRVCVTDGYMFFFDDTNETSYGTVFLNKDKTYPFTSKNSNEFGAGNMDVGYCYHGTDKSKVVVKNCNPQSVPENWVYAKGFGPNTAPPEYIYPGLKYQRPVSHMIGTVSSFMTCTSTLCNVECELPAGESDSNKCFNIFDGDTSTGYISKGSGSSTTFPADFTFTFKQDILFTQMKFVFNREAEAFGDFTISCGDIKDALINIKSVQKSAGNQFDVTFDKVTKCKVLKFTVKNAMTGGDYVVLTELKIMLKQSFNNYAKPNDEGFTTTGFKKQSGIGYFNNFILINQKAGEGQISFTLKGSELGLYGDYSSTLGTWEVTIDGKKPLIHNRYSEVISSKRTLYDLYGFEKGTHKVVMKVKSGMVNLDVVGFN
ncbi:hypothetical protein EIN_131490 [Entamoeba invadens IP1]|uniref:Uncharacterized protein n=1 Tax=Entamoeba invadens IP1 TaxID=370355 RepID=A0A0A1UG11_ENTIV|nr:hypothetical protein EIN_131490 [Entamoeba invadens IP1]ELP94330.1 hypothetical protein EIN_131490 [Entamoeba invadens IP1]|eukprot:XP_004261101.1 hypothetical protein EIN_131490 [Entamoeba invadens IP1]